MTGENEFFRSFIAFFASIVLHVLIICAFGGFDSVTGGKSGVAGALEPSDSSGLSSKVGQQRKETPLESASELATAQGSLPAAGAGQKPSAVVPEWDKEERLPVTAPKIYVVKPGDNLTRIAEKDKSSFEELAELNKTTVKKLAKLQVGQRIKLKNGF